jgi:hypothetical protein
MVVERLSAYAAQSFLREVLVREAATMAPLPAPSATATPPIAAEAAAGVESQTTPPTTPLTEGPAPTAAPLGPRQTLRRPSAVAAVDGAVAAAAATVPVTGTLVRGPASGSIAAVAAAATRRRGSVAPSVSDMPSSVSDLTINIIESLCSTGTVQWPPREGHGRCMADTWSVGGGAEADATVLIRGGLLTTLALLLTSGRALWTKRALRLTRHLLQSDPSGAIAIKVADACAAPLVALWPVIAGQRGSTGPDMDSLSFLLAICTRLCRFPRFQREAAASPEFLPSIVAWLAERYPPASVASDALLEILAHVAEHGMSPLPLWWWW